MSATSFLPLGSFSSSADMTRESWRGPPLRAGYSVTHTFIKRNVFLCHTIMSVKLLKSSYWTCSFLVCLSHVSGSHLWLESWMRFFFFVSHLHFRLFHVTLEQKVSFSIVILWKSLDLFLFTKKYPQSPVVAPLLSGWVYHSFFPLSTLPLWVPADKEVVERVVPADRN